MSWHILGVIQVRWLNSKESAIKAVFSNFTIVVSHLENSYHGDRADDVKLNHYTNATDNYKDDKDVQSFISDIIKYIQKRFENVNTESL